MTEDERLPENKDLPADKNFARRVKKSRFRIGAYLCIGLISMALIFAAGLANLWKNMEDGHLQRLALAGDYVERELAGYEDAGAEEMLDVLTEKGTVSISSFLEREIDHCYIRDNETGDVIGSGDVSEAERLNRLSERKMLTSKGRMYYEIEQSDRYSVILEAGTASEKEQFREVLPKLFLLMAAAALVYCAVVSILVIAIGNEKIRNRIISAVMFLLLLILSAALGITAVMNQILNLTDQLQTIYDDAAVYIDEVKFADDSEIEAITGASDAESGRLLLLDSLMDEISAGDYKASYDPDTVFDDDADIYDRVLIDLESDRFGGYVLQYFLETVMFSILAVIIFWEIANDRGYFRGKGEKRDPVMRSMGRLRVICVTKSTADALTVTVTATLLKSLLAADCGDSAQTYVSAAILAASLIALVCLFLLPVFIRLARGSARLMPFSLILCTVGSLLCYLAQSSLLYIIGYLVTAFGDTMFIMMFLMVPCEIMPEDRQPLREADRIGLSRSGGQLVGYVLGGTLAAMLPYRCMFLISFILLALMLVPAFRIAGMERLYDRPAKSLFFKTMHNRRFVIFLLLVQVPYAMISYYFKYVVPLNVEALDLTVALVSFIFFFRMLMKFLFKHLTQIKRFWEKFRPRTAVISCMSVTTLLFLMLWFAGSTFGMIVLTMLLALVEAQFFGLTVKLGYGIQGDNTEIFFGYAETQTLSRKCGKAIAASIAQFVGLLSIPIWMGSSVLLYVLLSRRDAKNRKN